MIVQEVLNNKEQPEIKKQAKKKNMGQIWFPTERKTPVNYDSKNTLELNYAQASKTLLNV